MRISVLALAAFSLHLTNALSGETQATGQQSAALQVNSWARQAADAASPIPSIQSDPDYEYTAVKFASFGEGRHIDRLADRYADITGWEHVGHLGSLPKYRVFRMKKNGLATGARLPKRQFGNPDSSDESIHQLAARAIDIEHVAPLRKQKRRLFKRALVSDSPHAARAVIPPAGFGDRLGNNTDSVWRNIADPLYGKQWHLVNTQEIGHDINVTGVWHQGVTGAGVTVALIDDGLDYSSDDLLENFDFRGSYDFNDQTKLPTPRLVDDYHGTRCAGQIAAARNDVCGVGVAYGAKVAGIRMLSKEVTDQDELAALNYGMDSNWIYSCSWGPNDDGATVQAPDKVIEDAFINGVENGRGGLGSVFVFATGNGGGAGDNCNFDGYTNSIYTMSIGAIDHLDKHPYYSERCSAQLVVTYSNGDNRGIVTTDLGLRRCTDKHGGTSAAAPLGAGIFALALSVRPDMTWRDMQHLAVRTAVPVDTVDSDWADVAQGRKYNHKYGFGKMDAWRIVQGARDFKHVGKQTKIDSPVDNANEDIPPLEKSNGESKSVVRKVEVTKEQIDAAKMKGVEHVTVVVDMEHEFRGNVEFWLESPNGVRSQLAAVRQRDSSSKGLHGWKFMSVKHWDENPLGTWSLQVRNAYQPKHKGTLKSWQLTIYGESTEPEPEREVPKLDGNYTPIQPQPTLPDDKGKANSEHHSATDIGEADNDTSASSNGLIDRGTAVVLSGSFFISGCLIAVLAMLFYMKRRERKLDSMRWTPLETMDRHQVNEEEVIFSTHQRRALDMRLDDNSDDDDGSDFAQADVTVGPSSSSAHVQKYYKDDLRGDEDPAEDDRTHANSADGSEDANEHERLV
ncbi:pheromone processing endoprotease [Coemansia guatemalensis]|uniref:Pheromone processing endoprotease n=1 Tax=Coemansia guatemalensis TaxID=2761395 RepID=A0A9W8HYT7_9FUNG|nr:pheromone processing endoprotease [Coemansia guatemalensis]